MILHQEADEIAYRCAFACQSQGYIWHGKTKTVDLNNKFTKTEVVKFFKEKKGKTIDVDYTLESYPIIEQEHIVNFTLDRMVEKLYDLQTAEFGRITGVNLWLSPSDHSNFRYGVANIIGSKGVGYKAGRPAKPHWLSHIRDRLINKWGAKEIHGYEADDALGMYSKLEGTVVSHIDKDINMIPGWHYNHVTEDVYYVNNDLGGLTYVDGKLIGRGLIFFYAQLLTGDSTDNIPGIKKIGAKRAYDLLHSCLDEEEAYNIVFKLYVQQYKDMARDALCEIADLLWIVRADRLTGRQYLHKQWLL